MELGRMRLRRPGLEAEITIGEITILAGPSGSGKSYVALALYAVLRALAARRSGRVLKRLLEALGWPELSARIVGYSVDIRRDSGGVRADIKGEGRAPLPVYLPADRLCVAKWYPLLAGLQMADGVAQLAAQALGPVGDFISMLFAAQAASRLPAKRRELYDVFVRHAGIEVYFDGDRIAVEWEEGRSDVQLAPSGFAGLAPLGLLLRYGLVKKGSFVVWEEPEAHLSKDAVGKVAGLISDLASRGVWFLLTAHSDDLIGALGKGRVYLFERRGRGYVAVER